MTTFKRIDWKFNVPNRVKLSFDQPKISDSEKFPGKRNIWYGIKQSIDGQGPNGFNATENLKEMICPFTGEKILLVPALNPDVALIHVQRCDPFGNAQLDGLTFMDIDMAMAANSVIITTERIISNDQIRRSPDLTKIPFFTVDGVVEVPYGCVPHECYGVYEPFFPHMDYYAELTKKDPIKGVKEYLDRFYYSPKNWNEYLDLIGIDEIFDATQRGRSIYDD